MNFVTLPAIDQALALADDADKIENAALTYAAAVAELKQRINSGTIDFENRTDLATDLLTLADEMRAFALRVRA